MLPVHNWAKLLLELCPKWEFCILSQRNAMYKKTDGDPILTLNKNTCTLSHILSPNTQSTSQETPSALHDIHNDVLKPIGATGFRHERDEAGPWYLKTNIRLHSCQQLQVC